MCKPDSKSQEFSSLNRFAELLSRIKYGNREYFIMTFSVVDLFFLKSLLFFQTTFILVGAGLGLG